MSLMLLLIITGILFGGILIILLSKAVRLPKVLLLLLFGLVLQNIALPGGGRVTVPQDFTTNLAIFGLAIIIFQGASKFKFRDFIENYLKIIKLIVIFMLLNSIFVGAISYFAIGTSVLLALLVGVLTTATAAEITISMFENPDSKIAKLLNIESIINSPLIVIIPAIIIQGLMHAVSFNALEHVQPFLQQIITGIGAGVFFGFLIPLILSSKQLKENANLSELMIIVGALFSYLVAEALGGNGVLSVTVTALMYGNIGSKDRLGLEQFPEVLSEAFQILIFVILGLIMELPFDGAFWIVVGIIYLGHTAARLLAVQLSFPSIKWAEKIFLTLMVPKGVILAIVVLSFFALPIPNIRNTLTYVTAIILVSIIISSVTSVFYNIYSRRVKEEEDLLHEVENLNSAESDSLVDT